MKITTIIVVLLIVVVLLSIVNVLLMFSMEMNEKNPIVFQVNKDSYSSIRDLPLDHSQRYYVHRNFSSSEKIPDRKDIVLASHCTGNHLHYLVTLTETWNGPISVAIIVPGYSLEDTLSTLAILYRCFVAIRERVSVHLLHPVSELPEVHNLMFHIQNAQASTSGKCTNALSRISSKNKDTLRNYARKIEYPVNLIRNIARRSIDTKYTLLIDIDMMPSKGLRDDFMVFAERNNLFEKENSFYNADTSVFVLPAFEVDDIIKDLPKTKAPLLALVEKGRARPFYFEICDKCQRPTNYEKWRSLKDVGLQNIDVGYEVKWIDPWEPPFIAPRTSPDYDERFKQYGFNRISHACEMHVAGFRYLVLDRGFLIHPGFKTESSFHKSKTEENDKNRILFRIFKEELKRKYPQSPRRCY